MVASTELEEEVMVVDQPETVWHTRYSFGNLTLSQLNSLDPLTAHIDIAVPLDEGAQGMQTTPTAFIEGERYGVFPVEIYRVGRVNYVQGYKDPKTGQDIPLSSLFEWLSGFDEGKNIRELVGITSLRTDGSFTGAAASDVKPIVDRRPDGSVAFNLQAPDYLMDPHRIHETFERIQNHEPETFVGRLGKKLFLTYGKEYMDRIDAGQYRWSHQPAIQTAVGMELYAHNGKSKSEAFRGWVASPTGSGKTDVEARLMKEALDLGAQNVLFITSRTILMNQTLRAFGRVFDEGEISRFDGQEKNVSGRVIMTTFQSARRLFRMLKESKREIPLVIWDEGHNLLWDRSILSRHTALAKATQIAFTATPGLGHTLTDLGFKEILSVPLAYTIETGVTPPIAVKRTVLKLREKLAEVGKSKKEDKPNALEVELELSIRAKIENFLEESVFVDGETVTIRPTFIEADSIEEGRVLLEQIKLILEREYGKAIADQVEFMHSEQSSRKNEDIVQRALEGKTTTIIGVDMIGEGLDIPTFEVIILKPWKRSEYRPFQDMGRVMRRNENGNPCLVIEIWPFEDADVKGYKSALQIMGVSMGDARVAFRSRKQYERHVADYQNITFSFGPTKGSERSYRTPYHFIITAVREKRNRRLVNIKELSQIAALVIPKYREYLASGGEPILAAEFARRDGKIKLEPNKKSFEQIAGFRWWLLPYFRLEAQQIQELARLMYNEEVAIGKRKPLDTVLVPRSLQAYIENVISESESGNEESLSREELQRMLAARFLEDFAIKSMEYTVTSLANTFLEDNDGEERITLAYFLDLIRVIHVLKKTPQQLTYLKPPNLELSTRGSELLGFVRQGIEKRISAMVTALNAEMVEYVHGGAGIESDVVYVRNREELIQIDEFVQKIQRVASAIRFGTTLLSPSQRGRTMTYDIYAQIRSRYKTNGYAGATEVRLVELAVSRLKLHRIHEAGAVPTILQPRFDIVFGIPQSAFETACRASGTSPTLVLSAAARKIDPSYDRSYRMYIENAQPRIVANRIAESLVEAGVDPEELTMDTILTVQRQGGDYVLPRIYVDLPFLSRGDGRSRASFKGYVNDILGVQPSDLMEMIRRSAEKMNDKKARKNGKSST